MNPLLILAAIACVLCFAVNPVNSIKCHVCKAGSSNCASSEEFDCSSIPLMTRCLKSTKGDVVVKSCSIPIPGVPDDGECKDLSGANTCICTKDLCNTASAPYTGMAALLPAAVVAVKWLL